MTTVCKNLRQTAPHRLQDALVPSFARLLTAFRELRAALQAPSRLSLVALALLVGFCAALAPVRWPRVTLGAPTATSQAVMATKGQPPGQLLPCFGLKVWFSEMATLGEIVALLGDVAAGLGSGPNRDGSFELAVPEGAAPAVAELLAQVEGTVEGVFLISRCSRP